MFEMIIKIFKIVYVDLSRQSPKVYSWRTPIISVFDMRAV